ncbi:MAG: hypothetical protein IKQ78_02130 [Bacilli bacterium]|nr:hypothetical protein [Bacilli bacterium]
MSKKYFKYLMKSFWPIATVYITLFAISLIAFPFVIDLFCVLLFRIRAIGFSSYMVAMGPFCIFLSGLLPLLMHTRYYSKNRSDVILSMPMNRSQAFITEGLFGLALITTLLVAGYAIGCGLCNALGNGYSALGTFEADLLGLPLLYLACVITFLSSTFAVSVANSGFQAVVMLLIVNALPGFLYSLVSGSFTSFSNLFSVFSNEAPNWLSQSEVFEKALMSAISYGSSPESLEMFGSAMIAFLCQFLFWGGMVVLAFFEFKKIKSENLGTVIPQRFGVVNSLTLMSMLSFALMTQLVMADICNGSSMYAYEFILFAFAYFLISVFYFVAIFIVRRKAKFRKDDWIRFAIAISAGIIVGVAMFGITRAITPSPSNYYYY